jgi:hypothetical protein
LKDSGGLLIAACVGRPIHGPDALPPRQAGAADASLLRPESGGAYKSFGTELSRATVSVHLFVVGAESLDLASLAFPCLLTGGSVTRYATFDGNAPMELHTELFKRLSNDYSWCVSMRLRLSRGLTIERIHANGTLGDNHLIVFPVFSPTDSIAFELAAENPLPPSIICQVGFVFTNTAGCRRVRVFTFSVPTTTDPQLAIAGVDEGALASFFVRQTVGQILKIGGPATFENMSKTLRLVAMRLPGFAALAHALLSQPVFRCGREIDWLVTEVIRLRSMSVAGTLLWLYPRMFAMDTGSGALPLTAAALATGCCFLVHTDNRILIWVRHGVDEEWLAEVFGVRTMQEIVNVTDVQMLERSANVRSLLNHCWTVSGQYLPIVIIPEGDPREIVFRTVLVDDSRESGGNLSEWKSTFLI